MSKKCWELHFEDLHHKTGCICAHYLDVPYIFWILSCFPLDFYICTYVTQYCLLLRLRLSCLAMQYSLHTKLNSHANFQTGSSAMQMLINFMILQEKDQQKKIKESKGKGSNHGRHTTGTAVVPNNHNISEYFNRGLDDVIQGLNHMTPLFVEKCVRYIEQFGELVFIVFSVMIFNVILCA